MTIKSYQLRSHQGKIGSVIVDVNVNVAVLTGGFADERHDDFFAVGGGSVLRNSHPLYHIVIMRNAIPDVL